jgi:glycosyltransferase involved in cell wall biosynthesis
MVQDRAIDMTLRIGFVYHFDDRAWQGGKNYFASLFSAVRAVAGEAVELVLLTGRRTQTTLGAEFPFLQVVRTPLLDRRHPLWIMRQLGRLPSSRCHDPLFGRLLKHMRIDLLSHSEPLRGRGSGVRSLGWLPDFQFLHLPELWSPAELERMRQGCERICRDSDALVLSSHAALADLRRFAPWFDKPAHVLHFVSAPAAAEGLRSLESLQAEHGLPPVYFHLPNQFWSHKNHRVVVEALALLRAEGCDATVVCTGHPSDPRAPAYFGELMERCRAAGIEQRFRVLGLVPYRDMQALMLHAHAVINPSRFEGWSTSVEEGRTMGKQLLLSDIAVHREQAPPGTIYFGVDDVAALAAALRSTLAAPRVGTPTAQWQKGYALRLQEFGAAYLQIVRTL